MLPQRGIPFRPPMGSRMPVGIPPRAPSRTPSKFLLSPKGALSSPFARPGMPSKISPRKPAPPKIPGSIFLNTEGKKQSFTESQMRERIRKVSPFLLKGKTFTKTQRERMIKQWFPWQKAQGYIDERKTTRVLKELRHKEAVVKDFNQKKALKTSRKLLEAFTRVRKY